MKKFNVNPANYDFLWKVVNQSYFLTSFWLHDYYRKRDFIFTKHGEAWETYIGKEERKKTSELGYVLMSDPTKFREYGNAVKRITIEAKERFKRFKALKYQELSDRQLSDELIDACKFCTRAWQKYFITEFFCYDKVEKVLREQTLEKGRLKIIQNNVHKMQRVKFDLRSVLNETAFGDHLFAKILKEISKRINIKLADVYNLGYWEIAGILSGKKIKIKYKETYASGRFSDGELLLDKDALIVIKTLKDYTKKHTGDILHGTVGNKGFYVGRVKIIPFDLEADLNKEIDKMKKGDVLVSGSTGPEMIRACHKAGAIVTEEGGITSHAAIVSREMGIPCVIATKVATEILKDGDIVEVDAINGVVKIIKRK